MSDNIDMYIADFPPEIRDRLQAVRKAIHAAVPDAGEKISYKMPTITLNGSLLGFAAWKDHIAMYPIPAGDAAFQKAIAPYRSGKSTARFPHNQPLPLDLIRQITEFRVEENRLRAEKKKSPQKK